MNAQRRCPAATIILPALAVLLMAGCTSRGASQNGATAQTPVASAARPDALYQMDQGSTWINSPALHDRDLLGHVVLVDFWEYTCVNCIRTEPYVKTWYDRYGRYGLVVVGVHAPEFDFAHRLENV